MKAIRRKPSAAAVNDSLLKVMFRSAGFIISFLIITIILMAGIRMTQDRPDVLPKNPPTITIKLKNLRTGSVSWKSHVDSSYAVGDQIDVGEDFDILDMPTDSSTRFVVIGKWIVRNDEYQK